MVDFTHAPEGRTQLYGKPSGVEEVVSTVKGCLSLGVISDHEASSLEGRVRFAREGHFGRCGAVALRALKRRATAGPAQCPMGEDLRRGHDWFAPFLPTALPRVVIAHPSDDAIHSQTELVEARALRWAR